ncbi:MAG: hypothetical protein R3C59_13975 [Planctomycetaceae bacterium]
MMHFRQFNAAFTMSCLAGAGLLLFIGGCSQNSDAGALPEVSVDAPATLTDGGTTWTKADIGAADQECLATFFQKNQQLVGSPDMEGQPVLFTSGKNDRRFYWLNATVDGSRWTCVHFEKSRYTTSEGTGSPF